MATSNPWDESGEIPSAETQAIQPHDVDEEMKVASDHDLQKGTTRRRNFLLYGLIGVGVVGIVIGIVLALSGGGGDDGPGPAPSGPTTAPVPAPTPVVPTTPGPTPAGANEVRDFIQSQARFGGSEFNDPASYQSRALTWVLTQDLPAPDIPLDMEAQALQLYTLACVYYNTYSKRSAWTDFHYGTGISLPGWFTSRGWLESANNVCDWHGITCNTEGRVEAIELDTNGLTGYFPPEVANLHESLKTIDLFNNLVHNKGDLGNSFLGELTNLEYLYYGTTSFEYDGVPTEIGLLTKLKEYDFSYSLYFGELRGESFAGLTNLSFIVMDGNAYNSSLPQELVTLPNLEFLYAGFSFLEGDLEFVSQMPKIFELWVDDNPGLSGPIPVSLTESETLVSLSITNCDLTGQIPTEFGNMDDLVQLWLYDNLLTGTIPTEFGRLRKLSLLNLQKNDLTGEMPSQLCTRKFPLGRLEYLEADCDGDIDCDEDCCTCCGEVCINA